MNLSRLTFVKSLFLPSLIALVIAFTLSFWLLSASPAQASIDDDRLDGNIFVVYAGNGSLVPPRLSLPETFERKLPAILVYYLDDSSDCKQYAFVVSRYQEFYGRAASIIPVSVDSIPPQSSYRPDEPGYYYQGVIPQTVVLNANKKVIFNGKGVVKFEEVDDVLRKEFNLLPRSESVELKVRTFNEFNSELVAE